jgi:serpin B
MRKIQNLNRLGLVGIPVIALVVAIMLFFTGVFSKRIGVPVYAGNLMEDFSPAEIEDVDLKEDFLKATADFSVELFKNAYSKGENSLVSPTSVYLALGMTANGAAGNTAGEFEALLGKNEINIKDLNAYYYSLANKLTKVESGKVSIANSIWYRDDESIDVKKEFLQANADYYKAAAYKADFSSPRTVDDINNWVKGNTGGLIDRIVNEIDRESLMYLINAVYFEDKWEKAYEKTSILEYEFNLADGTTKLAEFMHSEEQGFIKDTDAQGFIKPYKNGRYSFVALLPNEDIKIDEYIKSLSGDKFINLIKNRSNESVSAAIPKFTAEYDVELSEPLQQMGLLQCFNEANADFTNMGTSKNGNIFVDEVLHKTYISVDDVGTKAAAVTKVGLKTAGNVILQSVVLDRPFIYAIVDNETNLPLFIGTVYNPNEK